MPLYYLLFLWFLVSSRVEVSKIARVNQLIAEAEESFNNGQYILALVKYRYLINSLQIKDNHLQLNLAHCYYLNKDINQAQRYYEQVIQSPNAGIRSVALQQLGVIAFEKKQYNKARDYFRKSLTAQPENEDSRYNYEMVARLFPATDAKAEDPAKKDNKKAEKTPPPPPPDTENTIKQSESEQEDGSGQMNTEAEQQEQIKRKLRQINLSEEKASMILDAMKNNEIQYIQQAKKKASGKEEKNQPDW